jgi:signal transduction histidine kinase
MLPLPRLPVPFDGVILPLVDSTADVLLDVFLADDLEAAASKVVKAARNDFAFTLWLGLKFGKPQDGAEATDIGQLAERFVVGLPESLCWEDASAWWSGRSASTRALPELTRRLNRLACLERDFEAALHEQKLQAMYKLAAGAGHEINNPLGSIAGRAQLLLRDESDPERRRTLAKINTQAFRAHEMIADMMLFAKPPEPVKQPVDLVELIRKAAQELRDAAGQRNTKIIKQADAERVMVEADPTQLMVVIHALCNNALEALGGGGHIEILARRANGASASNSAAIVVRDNGPGIAPEHRPHLFDPFYSGREAGRGLGFGLSKCWRIVEKHGGDIRVESAPGHGATFTILLPAA